MFGQALNRVTQVSDLGIKFDSTLSFASYIESITLKYSSMLGFIIRNTRGFTSINCIKLLYISLIRSKFEYGSLIWNPYNIKYKDLLEGIQKRFFRFLYLKIFFIII